MPWQTSNKASLRYDLVLQALEGEIPITHLAEKFLISPKTAHKWINRFHEDGKAGLQDRSTKPQSSPNQTPEEIQKLLVDFRTSHPYWGPRKILCTLKKRHPDLHFPAPSTVGALFKRLGLVESKPKRRKYHHPGSVPALTEAPNDIWTVDFKGQFRTQDGLYCYPLTVVDQHTRYILTCKALPSTSGDPVKAAFKRLFSEFGLPKAIRSDNGAPFASRAIHGLSHLNAWWMALGILHQRIHPGCPQENGAHERMHRSLKRAVCQHPAKNLRAQQRAFNAFLLEFNQERPHEALDMETPASIYLPSERLYTPLLTDFPYPEHFLIKKVTKAGTFRLGSNLIFVSTALHGYKLGLEEIHDEIWKIHFNNFLLATMSEADLLLRP